MKTVSLNEIGLLPAVLSDIQHRSEINPFDINGKLPIFVAPMTCIIDNHNYNTFKYSRAIPIIPRGDRNPDENPIIREDNDWVAYSLEEFRYNLCDKSAYDKDWRGNVLIDVANGHMSCIYDYVREAKSIWGNQLTVMVGNIANPETYLECCKAGVNFVRVGIGGGTSCSTSVQTGIHASMVWLLTEIQNLKKEKGIIQGFNTKMSFKDYCKEDGWTPTKIIADGGIDTIDKAIKCLALGADYVMMGKLFAQCEEACGEIRECIPYTIKFAKEDFVITKERKYYGMASIQGQKDISGGVRKNPEGIEMWIPVVYSLDWFINKFSAALRSSMSMCGAHNLSEFIGKVNYNIQSIDEFNSYYK